MTQPPDTRTWTLSAAFARREDRDACRAAATVSLAAATDGSSAKTYDTEMTDGTPALGIDATGKDALAPLLSRISSTYPIKSISLYITG